MKLFVSKYALSRGIIEVDAPMPEADLVLYIKLPETTLPQGFFQNEWHTTRDAAIRAAETMRERKIAALRKQITKLEKVDFQ